MAYRFLLEVPEGLAAEGSIAVEEAGDAQVILVRDSHGVGFDEPYMDLTVAAHSLRVITTLYGWFDRLGGSRPDIRIVLHSGERLALEAHDRGGMVAAIRRDQPWVERSIPKIGEHEEELVTADYTQGAGRREDAVSTSGESGPAAGAALDPSWIAPAATAERTRAVMLRGLNHVAIQVMDLAKAERFYTEFFGMELLGRARRGPRGEEQIVNGNYRWDEATRTGTEADVSFVGTGALTLALQRAGRGGRLERGLLDHLSVTVDATTFTTLRGEVLMRAMQALVVAETVFVFRDPFGVTWELTLPGTPGLTGKE